MYGTAVNPLSPPSGPRRLLQPGEGEFLMFHVSIETSSKKKYFVHSINDRQNFWSTNLMRAYFSSFSTFPEAFQLQLLLQHHSSSYVCNHNFSRQCYIQR